MELSVLLHNSRIAQNWLYFVLSLLVPIGCSYIFRRHVRRTRQNLDLDGAELVGAVAPTNADPIDYKPALDDKEHIPYGGPRISLQHGAKQFYELVNDRRSVRSFSRRSVPLAIIEDCIRCAGTAPSGAHTEPWSFCVVRSAELKHSIRTVVELEESLNYGHRMHRQWTTDLKPLRTDHHKPYLTDAPYLILVFKQTHGLLPDGRRRNHYYNEISVAIAVGILVSALQAAGLSSLVTTPLNCGPALRTLLDRPDNEKLLMLLPVGYPADDCRVPDLRRKGLAEIMTLY